ncbi:MAG: VWA domain-containing protein [Acidobacteriaceae bacterium]
MSPARIALLISLVALPTPRLAGQTGAAPPPAASAPISPAQPSAVAQPAGSDQITTLHTTARLVVLDVEVNDGYGHAVRGLTQSDFKLSEDGVPQTLVSFAERDLKTPPPPSGPSLGPNNFSVTPAIPEDRTKTIVVLASPEPWVRADLMEYFKSASPVAPICIVRLDWQGMHLVQDFTSDPRVIEEALASKRVLPPLGFPVRFLQAPGGPTQNLARLVSNIPGRINIVWTGAGGIGLADLFPDLSGFVHDLNGTSDALRLSRVAIFPVSEFFIPFWDTMALLKKSAAATGGDAFFSGMKLALPEILDNGSDYYTLSYVPTNPNWNGDYRKIDVDVSGIPEGKSSRSWFDRFLGWDDAEAKIQYRRGYFAKDPTSVRSATFGPGAPRGADRKLISYSVRGDPNPRLTPMLAAMRFGALAPSEFPIKVTVTPSLELTRPRPGAPLRQVDGVAPPFQALPYRSCRVRYWVDPANLHFKQTLTADSFHASLEFAAAVYRDDGVPVTLIDAADNLDVDSAQMARLMQTGVTFDQTIAMPVAGNPMPGSFFLRAGVHDRNTDHVSVVMIPSEAIKPPSPQGRVPSGALAATH